MRADPARGAARPRRAGRRASTRRPRSLLYELLLEAKRAGTAVLLTTHQMGFADGLADRAVMLDEGEVADEGPWAEVRERAEARGWISR